MTFHAPLICESAATPIINLKISPMSFQGYLDTIKEKTGLGPEDFKKLGEKKGFLKKGILADGVKAGEIVSWLKDEYKLGHGHAMAIFALFKGIKKEGDK
jgi:hypothetical protein